MRMRRRVLAGVAASVALSVVLAACGGSSGGSGSNPSASGSTTGKQGGTLNVVMGTAPDSLDPQFGYTTQAIEGDNMVYTPLLTYQFQSGVAGTQLQPGLATALPTVSADQLTYTMTLRSGLKFSDGSPVVASDVTYALERAFKISWGGTTFYTQNLVGAAAYAAGKASTISGITTNDSTGQITFKLVQPYGAFANLLAFPAAAPVPPTTPMKVLSNDPPIGVGPYKFGKIVPNASYELVRNPLFAGFKIPNIPTGYVDDVQVTINSNNTTAAQQVLDNTEDVFDPGDTIPAGVLADVSSQAKDRYTKEELASVYYFFLNTTVAPFNNLAARTAVNMAVDRTALSRLSSGSLTPGCNFLPPTIAGHSDGPCSFGDPNTVPSAATVAKAKQMIAAAGLAGAPVTVWSETRSPRQEFCAYFTDLLNQIGFKATLKVIQDPVYFQTIGNPSLKAQAGFADWSQDFPNPIDFYLLLSGAAIQATNNENFGSVNDPKINSQLTTLQAIPATQLAANASRWQALDAYVASQSYVVPFGYETAPKFMSNRVNFDSAVFNSVEYMEFSTISLK
ncbi:MAG TPA: ABC transporter substrate-binding protein [Jatrophihabitantaceae bacterium]|jgi:peptide/nickel transport system substrate-binding protein|nr:ABC transporter substrate-binding protein [Jatrophihabitantaceae bacterium]